MQLESKKIVKSKWQDSTHFSTNYYFFGVYGVKMHIFKQKNNICTLVVQNIGHLSKKLELLD